MEDAINFQVEHQCPQCGAPVVLDETDRFFVCDFCRVRHCIHQKGYFRYQFSPSDAVPKDAELIYIPYWRFKGTFFACSLGKKDVDHRFVDVSYLAMSTPPSIFPHTLGVRSQALKLKLVSDESPGRFLKPLALKKTMETIDDFCNKRLKNQDLLFQEYIGESTSLIYSPVYLNGEKIIDGILNKPLYGSVSEDFDLQTLDHYRPEKETVFISGLCPSCGWDLEGAADSLALICRNCHSLWRPHGQELARIRFRRGASDNPDAAYLPFWRIETDVSGVKLKSYADLVSLANLPKVTQPHWHDIPFMFWAPAFKIRPKIFLRLIQQMAFIQPSPELVESLGRQTLYPVTLPATEAIESMKLSLAAIMRPPQKYLPKLPDITITPKKIKLIYLPFEQRHHDFYHPDLDVSINKNIMSLSKNL